MAVTAIKPYFVTRMKALSYVEHKSNVFNDVNENKLNKSFHVEIGNFSASSRDQRTMELSCPVTLRAFYKGSKSESARDKALEGLDEILNDLCAAANRLGADVKNVLFQGSRLEALSDTNSLDQVLVCDFSASVIYVT